MTKRRTKVNLIINFGLDYQSRIAIPAALYESVFTAPMRVCSCQPISLPLRRESPPQPTSPPSPIRVAARQASHDSQSDGLHRVHGSLPHAGLQCRLRCLLRVHSRRARRYADRAVTDRLASRRCAHPRVFQHRGREAPPRPSGARAAPITSRHAVDHALVTAVAVFAPLPAFLVGLCANASFWLNCESRRACASTAHAPQ